jgi:hypothetical protein
MLFIQKSTAAADSVEAIFRSSHVGLRAISSGASKLTRLRGVRLMLMRAHLRRALRALDLRFA